MQKILARTYSVFKKKKKAKNLQLLHFFQQRAGVSLLAGNADILVHLIQRSLKLVQIPTVLVGFVPHSARAADLLTNPSASAVPVPRP